MACIICGILSEVGVKLSKVSIAGMLMAAAVVAAAGAFGGMWAWTQWQAAQVRSAEQAASAAAAAERASPKGVQRDVVRSFLNDPDSAQFRDDRPALRGKGVWCGEVNARNRMGGLVGYTRYVAQVNEDRELGKVLDDVYFEQTNTTGKDYRGSFESKWRAFCE